MQDPNADTEWNDILRSKGIIPQKEKEVSEEDIIDMVEKTIEHKSKGKGLEEMTLDELGEHEDEIDEEEERIFQAYRLQRLAEMKERAQLARYGDVREITKEDYVTQVNKAGDGVWVILHVYKNVIPLCKIVNHHLTNLARKFPETKFLRSVSDVCIPNYPDKNLPTIFIYCDGEMKKQFIGPHEFRGTNLTQNDLEWMLKQAGAVKSDMEKPSSQVRDVMDRSIKDSAIYSKDSDDSDDDY
ncbi:hypothetical protein ScPMuIL_007394 [Solemya velum]